MIATTRPLTNRPLVSTVFLHDVTRRTTGWPAEPAGGQDVARRPAEDRSRSVAHAPVPAPTRSPEDEDEEYERWDGMA